MRITTKITGVNRLNNSINGNPNIVNKPSRSILDLNGVPPPTYRDNAPEGASL